VRRFKRIWTTKKPFDLNATVAEAQLGLDFLALTQAQIEAIREHHSDCLKKGGNGTFRKFSKGLARARYLT
jgi:hypothetical protein